MSEESVSALIERLKNAPFESLTEIVTSLRRMLSAEVNPPIDETIRAGGIPLLVGYIQRDDVPDLQTAAVVNAGVVPLFVRLVTRRPLYAELQGQSVWALGNIAGDSVQFRDMCHAAGVLQAFKGLAMEHLDMFTTRNLCWAYSNLYRSKPSVSCAQVVAGVECPARWVMSDDQETKIDALWCLSYMSDGEDEKIQAVINTGCLGRVVAIASSDDLDDAVRVPAVRIIGNVVSGNEEQTQTMINLGCLNALKKLLEAPKRSMRKESAWALSNITAGTQSQIESVLNSGAFPLLFHMIYNDEIVVKTEAMWALSNATSGGSPDQMQKLVGLGCIPAFGVGLRANNQKIMVVALEGVTNILQCSTQYPEKFGNLRNLLQQFDIVSLAAGLVDHPEHSVAEKACSIMDVFFPDGDVAPLVSDANDDDDDDVVQQFVQMNFQPSGFQASAVMEDDDFDPDCND